MLPMLIPPVPVEKTVSCASCLLLLCYFDTFFTLILCYFDIVTFILVLIHEWLKQKENFEIGTFQRNTNLKKKIL